MDKKLLLQEVEDIIRSTPKRNTLQQDSSENHSWFGRASAIMAQINISYEVKLDLILSSLLGNNYRAYPSEFNKMMILLHKARNELSLEIKGPTSTVTDHGKVFDFFDEIRKIIELATSDIIFVDPYLDADFVSRYLPFVKDGVSIRLLSGTYKLSTLVPSVEAYVAQAKNSIELRTAPFHDRFIFIDKTSCYQSGASFKDGAKNAPITITQIVDAFSPMLNTYENLWDAGDKKLW